MAKEPENVQVYDAFTAKWRKPLAADRDKVAEHAAQVAGEPAPGDRTEDQLRNLPPSEAGPVLTPGTLNVPTNA